MDITAPVWDYIKRSLLTTKGDLLIRGTTELQRLPVGTGDHVLMSHPTGEIVKWESLPTLLNYLFQSRGDLLVRGNTWPQRLSIGNQYDVLTVLSNDVQWVGPEYTLTPVLEGQGEILIRDGAVCVKLILGTAKQLLNVNAGETLLEYITPYWIENALLTTQGDIVKRGAAAPERMAIGSAKQVLAVNDAGNDLVYKYEHTILTTQGDIIKRGAAAPERMARGTANQVLSVNAAGTDLEYKAPTTTLFNTEYSSENGAQVNLLAADVTITTLDVGTRTTGSRLLVCRSIRGTKDGTSGPMHIRVKKASGTAEISFVHDEPEMYWARGVGNNEYIEFTTMCICNVNTGGTLVLELYGNSEGSNYVIPAGGGQLSMLVMKE